MELEIYWGKGSCHMGLRVAKLVGGIYNDMNDFGY